MKIVFEKSLVFLMLILFHISLKPSQKLTVDNLRGQIWRHAALGGKGIVDVNEPNHFIPPHNKACSDYLSEADSLKIYKGLQEGPGELLTQVERNSCIILDFAGSKASDRITFNNGNLDQVQSLPSGGSNVNAASPQNNTALVGVTAHSVVGKDDILRKVENPKWIKKLLDGVDVTIAFNNNAARILYQGTLYRAILDDDFRIVEYLVKNSLFFTHSPKDSVHSVFSEGFTPIMLAGGLGQIQTVRTLLDCEANVSKVSDGGNTAFDFALRGQHYGVALMILNHGFYC